jgi:hypothetical protein
MNPSETPALNNTKGQSAGQWGDIRSSGEAIDRTIEQCLGRSLGASGMVEPSRRLELCEIYFE